MKRKVGLREKDIQKSIQEFLALKGIFNFKVNTVGIYKKSTGSYIPSPSVGCPDIICIIRGRFIGIEVKRPGGRLSEHQLLFRENIEDAKGLYWVFTSLDETVSTIEDYLKVGSMTN